jgi:uncharacterized membrane protein YecN with MAPEG domain
MPLNMCPLASLLFMEMNGAQNWMVHVCGILLIAGRLMHSTVFTTGSSAGVAPE